MELCPKQRASTQNRKRGRGLWEGICRQVIRCIAVMFNLKVNKHVNKKAGVVAQSCNHSTWKTEAKRIRNLRLALATQ